MHLDQKHVDTVVVGAGQAGIAMSEHLTQLGISHVVLEKHRIAEAWRSRRWDSLVANGPCWHDRFPNMAFDADPESFVHHEQVAHYFEHYAKQFNAPIHTGIEVYKAYKHQHHLGFVVETSAGTLYSQRIVAATGAFQKAVMPAAAPVQPNFYQIHSDQYRNPAQLPAGAVLVIGSGASGVQIADELNRAGRNVYLSVGPHERPPRRYRHRDNVWWLGVLGGWDFMKTDQTPLKGLAVTGARGGVSIDFRVLAEQGITLLGMTKAFEHDHVYFQPDLASNIYAGDQSLFHFLDQADCYVTRNGLDLPEEPLARQLRRDPECVTEPILHLNLPEANIQTVIWASGYRCDFSWLQVNAFDAQGQPQHKLGISSERGVYFLGLPYLSGRGSSFIWGVWHDAQYIAQHIRIQQAYLDYQHPYDPMQHSA